MIEAGDQVIYKRDKYWVLDIIKYENMEDTALLGLTKTIWMSSLTALRTGKCQSGS